MLDESALNAEIDTLLATAVDQHLDDAQLAQLQQLMRERPEVLESYVEHAILHAMLQWEHAPPFDRVDDLTRPSAPPAGEWPIVTDDQSGDWRSDDSLNRDPAGSVPAASGQWPVVSDQQTTGGLSRFSSDENGTVPLPSTNPQSQIPNSSPYLGFLGSAYHGVTGYVAKHDVLFGLLIVTLLFIPIAGFAVYVLLQPKQQVAEATKPEPLGPALFPHEGARAGAITGTLDCVWKDSQLRFPETDVCVGDVLRIDAGLMEITYDSGAKVILQAPTTYTVTSKTGGYLDIGRLTAKMGATPKAWQKSRFGVPEAGNEELGANNEERRTNKEELPAPASPSRPSTLDSPLFAVTTPSAIVTDLGTEFGVHVDNRGATESLVFVGTVTVQTPAAEGEKPAHEETLHSNDSARVEQKGQGEKATYEVQRTPVKAESFVRTLARPSAKPTSEDLQDDSQIVERFSNGQLGKHFEQMPPGCYKFEAGDALYQPPSGKPAKPVVGKPAAVPKQSRGYIRTVATDYCDRDFVFDAVVSLLSPSGKAKHDPHRIYFGIGDGVPNANYYDLVSCGLVLDFTIDSGRVIVRLCYPEIDYRTDPTTHKSYIIAEVAPPGSMGWGRHRLRLTKRGGQVQFAVQKNCYDDDPFKADFESPWLDLAATMPQLNTANSRLLIGTGNLDTVLVLFKELSIKDLSHEKQDGAERPGK